MPSTNCKTNFGTFRVTISDDTRINVETREFIKKGTLLSVGGNTKCVFLNIPDDSDTAHLLNVKTKDGGCEVYNKAITGKDTIGMVNLAFTILKQIAPHIKHIKLEDESDFTCTLPDGTIVGISMTLYDLLFYQKAYYEKRYGAYLTNPELRTVYEQSKQGFNEKPPRNFHFRNKDLDEMLGPIYLESATWKEFLDKLHTFPNLCAILFPWYKYAANIIFKGINFERQHWTIDLYDNPKLEDVQYTVVRKQNGGRRRKTRKSNESMYTYTFDHLIGYIDRPFYDDVWNMKYQ